HDLHRRAMRGRSRIAFHKLRIGIKRFRYIVENFLPEQHAAWGGDLKRVQDLLGEVHDLDVLWATATQIHAFPDEESCHRWQPTNAQFWKLQGCCTTLAGLSQSEDITKSLIV